MKKRSTNLDILRIISMLMIICHHCLLNGFGLHDILNLNQSLYSNNQTLVLILFNSFVIVGVNIFFLLSGYFRINFKKSKFIYILLQVYIVYNLVTLIGIKLGYVEFNNSLLLTMLNPISSYWFILVYLIVMLLSPILNNVINYLKKNNYKYFIIISVIVLCIYGFINMIFYNDSGIFTIGGKSLLWGIYLYILGGLISIIKPKFNKGLLVYFLTAIINGLLIYLLYSNNQDLIAWLFYSNSNILVLIESIALLLWFVNMKKQVPNFRIITTLATSTLMVYLLHSTCWLTILRNYPIKKLLEMNQFKLGIILLPIYVIIIYILCTIVNYIYKTIYDFINNNKTNNKLYLITILILLLIIFLLITPDNNKNNNKEEIKTYNNIFELNEQKNDNYVFIGDSLTKEFDLNSFYEYKPVINKGDNLSTRDIINDIDNLLIKYNPTKVIIETGRDDLRSGVSIDDEYNDITELIEIINKKRPSATIYLESIYPVDEEKVEEIKNEDIKKLNNKLKKKYKNTNIQYVDVYSHLIKNNKLNEEFSEDGYSLNKNGYIRIYTIINSYLKEEEFNDNIYNIDFNPNENIVFVGDSLTHLNPLDSFFEDFPIVNNGISGYKSYELLENLDSLVYDYNPTKVFINIGINDLRESDKTQEEIFDNIVKIIEGIQKNRPYAKIYIQSIYPINITDHPKIKTSPDEARILDEIVFINNNLKEKYKDTDVTYIDTYSKLVNKDGQLKITYTREGLHLVTRGYVRVEEVLLPYIAE